ncbi:hypothetical protein NliqN6_6318 [Naganishia liquefaciens]|uniref:Uncharacterized protein n=1 Tax=Naganishia liquefaciens TaxID=104408 RepID=A0A8H3TZT4_9TREE|nr:hypothetical protein NliqN6_6318 [Naganishia liquefaciens]
MAEAKPSVAGNGTPPAVTNGVTTRTSTLRKSSQVHAVNNPGTSSDDVQAASSKEDGRASTSGKGAANGVKRGTKRALEGTTAASTVMDEAAIKRSLSTAMESDEDAAEDDEDAEGKKIYLAKRDKRRLLRVLTVLSLPPVTNDSASSVASSTDDSAHVKRKARMLQLLLDQSFTDEDDKSNPSVTLREMLSGKDRVKANDLTSHVNMLAHALVPSLSVPFPGATEDERANPYLNARLAGSSRAKQAKDKEAALIDAFATLTDVISTILSPQKSNDTEYIPPNPKIRWALHQRLGNGPSTAVKGAKTPMQTSDWFSAATESINNGETSKDEKDDEGDVDMDKVKREDKEDGPLARLQRERAFGNANLVTLPPPVANNSSGTQAKVPTLEEVLFVHPSRANGKSQWKERRQQVRTRASVNRTVTYPRCYSTFTPSFAPTHDSSSATSGFGYYPTWDAAIGKANVHSWLSSSWNSRYGAELETPIDDEFAQIQDFRPRATKDDIEDLLKNLAGNETTIEIDPALVEAVDQSQDDMRELQRKLDQNAVWVKQLQEFQEIRLHRGQRKPLEEEDRLAQRLQQSLLELASTTTPKALLPKDLRKTQDPIAVVLARKVIHTTAPSVRGTLDPARPKALSDNTTIVARPPDQIAPPMAKPAPVVSTAPRPSNMPPMRGASNQQWQAGTGPQRVIPGASPQGGPPRYTNPLSMQAGGSRYAFPPASNPVPASRSSPIPPMNGVPSVLRNSLPQPVGLGSFSPVGRSTLAPTNAPFAGQSGRGIGSSMGMQMNASGMNGSPMPAFRLSNSMRN